MAKKRRRVRIKPKKIPGKKRIARDHAQNKHNGGPVEGCGRCSLERISQWIQNRNRQFFPPVDDSILTPDDEEGLLNAIRFIEEAKSGAIGNIITIGQEYVLRGQFLEGSAQFFEPFQKLMTIRVIRRTMPSDGQAALSAVEKVAGRGIQIFCYWDALKFVRTRLEMNRKGMTATPITKKEEEIQKPPNLNIGQTQPPTSNVTPATKNKGDEIAYELLLKDNVLTINGKPFQSLQKDGSPLKFLRYMLAHNDKFVDYSSLMWIPGSNGHPIKRSNIRKFTENIFRRAVLKKLRKVSFERADGQGALLHNPVYTKDLQHHGVKLPKVIPAYRKIPHA